VDIAWVNSGVVGDTSFRNWNWDVVERILDTNLRGAIYTAHACLRHMVPRGSGTIVAISSAAAMRGLGGRALYSLTKIGLSYYMDSMAVELPQIQFTTIYPGFVDTPINRNSPNRFWVMQPQKAAQLMIWAVERGKASYIYPFRMKLLFYAIRLLPDSIYRRIARRSMELTRPAGGSTI
jgi:short-subunit dehydrogenase